MIIAQYSYKRKLFLGVPMNFMFTDISQSILNTVQSGISQSDALQQGQKGFLNDQVFANKLDKIINRTQQFENMDSTDAGDGLAMLSNRLDSKTGMALLSELKNIFISLSKGDLKNISIDEQGLETLKKLLEKAGFKSDELDTLMADLTQGLEEDVLTMDDLFSQLFDLPSQTNGVEAAADLGNNDEQFLEISALPFLNSILSSLGLDNEKIQQILGAAEKGEQGISLDVFIEKLKEVQKQAFYTHTSYQTENNADQAKILLDQLGLETNPSKTSPLTLDELVDTFEKMRNTFAEQKSAQSVLTALPESNSDTGTETADLMKSLFGSIKMENLPEEKQILSFSFEQVKNQFETDLLLPKAGQAYQKGLFADPKAKKDGNVQFIKDGLKEISSSTPGVKESAVDGKAFINQLKGRTSSLNDQSQVSALESKSSSAESGQSVLKSKASFKNLPNHVTQQVSKGIVRAINQGENTLKIQLKPAALGKLTLTIDNSGNNMKVHIVTEHAATREILASSAQEIRTVLSNSGVTLEQFDVDMNSDFRQSMADAGNQTGNSDKRGRNREHNGGDPLTNDITNEGADLMEAIDQGLSLHFVA